MRGRWPSHLKRNLSRRRMLRAQGNSLRAYYGGPVYLVGSALYDFNPRPRDWDIRIVLSDDDFQQRYGISAQQWRAESGSPLWSEGRWRWADDCVKQSKVTASLTGLNIDLQVFPASHAEHFRHKPRLRLDTRPFRVRSGRGGVGWGNRMS